MAKKKTYSWVSTPQKASVKPLSDKTKQEIEAALMVIVEKFKAFHKENEVISIAAGFNYCVDVYTQWYRHYLYLVGKYKVGGEPQEGRPTHFEIKSARITCLDENTCDLAYFRHTGQFFTIFEKISYKDAIQQIDENDLFCP